MPGPLISIVITVLNEAKNLQDLLDSLSVQEGPVEVLVVDAGSTDRTTELVRSNTQKMPYLRLLVHPGTRGASRNHGVQHARGDFVAFIDGDCIANAFWLHNLRSRADEGHVLAGRTIQFGYWAFERLERVELRRRGFDITLPSSNLFYPREAFLRLGGFDPRFITAEDIDLNFRGVGAGLAIRSVPEAVVYHRARDSIPSFFRQALWNGYGRKQLTLKHGRLWREYRFRSLVQGQLHFWGMLRMFAAMLGYLLCKLRESRRDWSQAPLAAPHGVGA